MRMTSARILAALLAGLISLSTSATTASAEDWPQFRGHNGSGVSTSKHVPTSFSRTDKLLWQADLGDGIGSPIIVGGRVFSTAMANKKAFAVFCHDAATGKPLWSREFATGALPRITPPNSHASSTPASDGKRVFVYFSTLGLIALDAESGKDIWRLPLRKPAYLMDWGAGSSPVVHGDTVYFSLDDDIVRDTRSVDEIIAQVLSTTEEHRRNCPC